MTILSPRALTLAAVAALLAGCPTAGMAPSIEVGAPVPATILAGAEPVASATPASSAQAPAPAAAWEAPRITVDDAKQRLDQGEEIVIVDVRDRSLFEHERLAGAISAPWADIRAGHALPPKDKLLLLYCT